MAETHIFKVSVKEPGQPWTHAHTYATSAAEAVRQMRRGTAWPKGTKIRAKRIPGESNPHRSVSKSTGWLKAKAVRIVKQGGRTVVQIKRAVSRRKR